MEAAAHRVCENKSKRVLVYTAVHISLPWRRVLFFCSLLCDGLDFREMSYNNRENKFWGGLSTEHARTTFRKNC